MKLSLCIATYNEEKNIHYPLDSALDIVDEVIIIDGGSIDKTVEIAKSYGKKIKVINSENPIMFHKNKQKAIEAARGEWILQLDADEELTDELKNEIKELIRRNFQFSIFNFQKNPKSQIQNSKQKEIVAFWLPRKNFFLTRFLIKGGQYPDYTIRLYRNGYARFPCKDVHENVEIKGEIGYLKNSILHYADPDFSRYLMRWDRYTTMETERIYNMKHVTCNINFFQYFITKPLFTFFSMYFRHKGFMDGFPGFVFALFSSIRFWVIYVKFRCRGDS
ncbi:MAG: glycosyltransferase family 2 protein [Candidatus Roizmanbacteria bacterium]|nr:glycosyltransferase family 2 protein [Candidatus Roizmanbacteria bacterium]